MPFLHGFRRIVFEYQPLVEEILGSLGLRQEAESTGGPERQSPDFLAEDDLRLQCLGDLLRRKSLPSFSCSFFRDGVSYALLKVAELGLLRAAETLLLNGADVAFEDPVTYYTALHMTVLRNQPEVVGLLVRHGADLNRRDRIHGSSPLDLASEEAERLPCLQRLLELGAHVNAADRHGKTALLHALASSDGVTIHNTENIRLLLEGGADVGARTREGDSAFSALVLLLGEAASAGSDPGEAESVAGFCFRAAQLLTRHGGDPSACPPDASLTLFCLRDFGCHSRLLRLLLESGAACHCSRHGPDCWSGFGALFQRLAKAQPDGGDDDQGDGSWAELLLQAQAALELMLASALAVRLPEGFEADFGGGRFRGERLRAMVGRLEALQRCPPLLKHLCRVSLRRRLRPWPLGPKVRALPLPRRLKRYLLLEPEGAGGQTQEEAEPPEPPSDDPPLALLGRP